jgi:tRNA A37 threonylcarbamoyladenosine biosynthesis protein TsaE
MARLQSIYISYITVLATDIAAEALCKLNNLHFTDFLAVRRTTLVDWLLKNYNVQGLDTSSTYTYWIECKNDKGEKLHHLDQYSQSL